MLVSEFECTFPLYQTCGCKVVSPSVVKTYGQSSSAACFEQHSDEKPKVEMKTKSNCASNGLAMLAIGLSGSRCNNLVLILEYV